MMQSFTIANDVSLQILRLDLKHSCVQGNKYYKLKYNLQKAKESGAKSLVTFGGAYSNHLLATAAAGNEHGFKTLGIIRGDCCDKLNHTLQKAADFGMEFNFVNREMYRNLRMAAEMSPSDLGRLLNIEIFSNAYLIPEGGTNELAVEGAKEILAEVPESSYDVVCVPVGTGGTLSGIINGLNGIKRVIGYQVLKGNFLSDDIQLLLQAKFDNWELNADYHFGGYAKFKPQLIEFINSFKSNFNVPLCPIYTGKMMFGILQMAENNAFVAGTRVLAVHTGGLQGIKGFNARYGNIIHH